MFQHFFIIQGCLQLSILIQYNPILFKDINMTSPSNSERHIKNQEKNNDKFKRISGECFLALEQYKLKLNMIGCNMSKDQFQRYYNYYESKPRKRLEICRQKINSMVKIFQTNALYLQGLQLKTVNNMMKIYRKRMDLLKTQNKDHNIKKFSHEEQILTNAILENDYSKLQELQSILAQIKKADEKALEVFQGQNEDKKLRANFNRIFKIINKSEVHYFSYYQSFQRSIANMVNQLHAHMEKLNKFYTVWENLGSSLIYEMKSDKEVFIDKSLEEKRIEISTSMHEENDDYIEQVINVMPQNSKIREQYLQRLENSKNKYRQNQSKNINFMNYLKNRVGNVKSHQRSISKVNWYETDSEDIKDYEFKNNMALKETDDGYFRYTFEQVHKETLQYIEQLKQKNIFTEMISKEDPYFDRMLVYCQKKQKTKVDTSKKIGKYNVPPQMSFSCWYDRLGVKGAFSIQDFSTNIFQRKIEFELDRQAEMQQMDERRMKQYNNKEAKLNSIDHNSLNMGYKELDHEKEVDKFRRYMKNIYNPHLLPLPKFNLKENSEQLQFSDEQAQAEKKVQKKIFLHLDEQFDESQILAKSFEMVTPKQKKEQTIGKKKNEKISQQFSKNLELSKNQQQKNKKRKDLKLNMSQRELKQLYPWIQLQQEDEKNQFQVFSTQYLLQNEKIMISKAKSRIERLGYSEEEIEKAYYSYLPNYQYETLRKSLRSGSKSEEFGSDKHYLINEDLYVKIDPIFFHTTQKKVKVLICMITENEQFQKLKFNLSKIFSTHARCTFNLNLDLIDSKLSHEQRFYGMVGHLLQNRKSDITFKNILPQAENSDVGKLIIEGEKTYMSFKKYYEEMEKITQEIGL